VKRFFAILVLLSSTAPGIGQNLSLYQKQWFIQSGDTLPYRLLLPETYTPGKSYPLIFFLHGRGESGNDNEKQLTHGATLFLRDSVRKAYPAIVVFPQCGSTNYWSNVHTIMEGSNNSSRLFYFIPGGDPSPSMRLLTQLVDNIMLRYPVNRQQVYVGGLSMGGMGTYELVRRKPDMFAAAFAICGGAHPGTAPYLKKTAWWIFHGLKDDVVPPEKSEVIAKALKRAGAKVKLTLYPGANHNSWEPAFNEPGLMKWLFSQKLANNRVIRGPQSDGPDN
jgi:predicted peptidase